MLTRKNVEGKDDVPASRRGDPANEDIEDIPEHLK